MTNFILLVLAISLGIILGGITLMIIGLGLSTSKLYNKIIYKIVENNMGNKLTFYDED